MTMYQVKELELGLEFKVEDLWIGIFWKREELNLDIWVCLLPMLPIHLKITYMKR